MAANTNIDGTTLTVERIYNASQESVFDAWITASKTTLIGGGAEAQRKLSRPLILAVVAPINI